VKDIITEIRELPNGISVTVNDRYTVRLTRRDQKSFFYKEGDALDFAAWKHELLLQQYPEALNRAVRLLAVRARSHTEIEKRLSSACYMDETVEMVLTKLQGNGLLDDAAFARQWAQDRTARQIGKARILYELRQKGVSSEVAEAALTEMDPQQQDESAVKLAAKLIKRYQSLPAADARRKTIQAMQRRGYSYGEARDAIEQAAEEDL